MLSNDRGEEKIKGSFSRNQNSFFNEMKEILPNDLVELVYEYTLTESDFSFLKAVGKTTRLINTQIYSDNPREAMNSLLKMINTELKPYLKIFSNHGILFGLKFSVCKKTETLSPEQQKNVIELGRALVFLGIDRFKYCPQIQTQYYVYALKAYVNTWDGSANYKIKELLNSLFNQIIPKFPNSLPDDKLEFLRLYPYRTFNTSYYDDFLCDKFEESASFRVKYLEKDQLYLYSDTYQLNLREAFSETTDPLQQLALINASWGQNWSIRYCSKELKAFYNFLAAEAKRGIAGASVWIVSSNRHERLDVSWVVDFNWFSVDDLFLFLHHSMKFNTGNIGEYIVFFVKALVEKLNQHDPAHLGDRLVTHFTGKENNNVYWHRIQFVILQFIHENRPDLVDEFALIKTDFEKNSAELQEKNKLNPLSKDYFEMVLQDLNAMDMSCRKTLRLK